MDWGTGNDGSTTTAWSMPDLLSLELLRAGRDREAAAIDAHDCPEILCWRAAPGAHVAIPVNYTPTYAYPLIVWLCDEAAEEQSVRGWLERISPRNYIALALSREQYGRAAAGGEDSGEASRTRAGLLRFTGILRRIASELCLHPDRRYVAGAGSAARIAIEWLLRRPDWFAGGVALDADRPSAAAWRKITPGLCRQRLLWVESGLQSTVKETPDPTALRCLGLRVDEWRPVGIVTWEQVADRINNWIMSDIPSAILR